MNLIDPKSEIFDPTFLRRREDLERLFLTLLKGGLNKQARDQVGLTEAQLVNQLVTPSLASGEGFQIDEKNRLLVKSLQKIGYVYLDNLFSPSEIEAIKAYLSQKHFDADTDGMGKTRSMMLQDVTPDISFGHFHISDICACEHFYRVIHDPTLIRMVARYLGAPPTIGIVSSWWSFPAAGPPAGMQTFHHDRGDFRSCNLFVYLTDVDLSAGPHAFVERTHEMSVLMPLISARFGNDPAKFNAFWQWMEQHRKQDHEIRQFFLEQEIKQHTGLAGTNFFEDTRGLHKGTRPTTSRRLVFEIFYSIMPKMNESITPIDRATLNFPAAHTASIDPLVRYATRQYFR